MNNVLQHNKLKKALTYLEKRDDSNKLNYIKLWKTNLSHYLYSLSKRFLDISISLVSLILLSPILVLTSIFIKLTDGGPVLYWSNRVGVKGKIFHFPKFRSMIFNADTKLHHLKKLNKHGENDITFKIKNDPRVTFVGKWIRRFSIDELPQLWCVLFGSMTLVGPRPPIPDEVKSYTLKERHRLDIKPGITCIWQVSGRADIPFPKQMLLDLEYVQKRSFKLDLILLLKTIPAVISGKGAY